MKKVQSFAVTLLILCPVLLNAQIMQTFGFKVGGIIADQTWDYTNLSLGDEYEPRLGLDAGLFVEALRLPFASVLMEAHYTQKGMHFETIVTSPDEPDGVGATLDFNPRVDYLSFPILAKVEIPVFLSTYILAGPRFDIRIGQKPESFQDVYDHLERYDAGATFGLGFELPVLTASSMLAEIRYSPSFTNAFENENLTVKNKSVEVLVGLTF